MKVYLIRHGESIGNVLGINQGQKNDFSLTQKGVDQSKRIAEKLATEPIDAVYSSDLKRAMETAEIMSKLHGLQPIPDKRLRERDFGDLDEKNLLKSWKAHVNKTVEKEGLDPWEVKAPNGESDKDHWDRLQDFFNEKVKQHPNDTIIAIAHAGSNKVSLGVVGHFSKEEMYKTYQGNTGLNEFEYKEDIWTIKQVNNINHLDKDNKALEIFTKIKNEKHNFKFNERWRINKRLFDEFKKEGYRVKYQIVSFKWEDQKIPQEILKLNHPSIDKHLIVLVKSQGVYQKVDLSDYPNQNKTGEWDSYGDSPLSIIPNEFLDESQEENFAEIYGSSLLDERFDSFYEEISNFRKGMIS